MHSDLNKLHLIRNAEFILWFFVTFKKLLTEFNKPVEINSDAQLNEYFMKTRNQIFHGFRVASLDMKLIHHSGKAYNDYPPSQKHFSADPHFPAHPDFPRPLVRYMLLGRPHGNTAIINAAKMTKIMRDNLIKFLKDPLTLVCTFDVSKFDLAFHLTFSDFNVLPYSIYNTKSKKGKNSLSKNGPFGKNSYF